MNSQKAIYLIRHAQSQYNIIDSVESAKGTNILDYKFREDLIDCDITERGYEQAKKAAEDMKDINVTLVLVSPLLRALRTCYEIFKDHKNKPKVVVWPWSREIVDSSCDIPGDLEELKSKFPTFDFSMMDALEDKDCWILETIYAEDSKEELSRLKDMIQPDEDRGKAFRRLFCKKLHDNYPTKYDKGFELVNRSRLVMKQFKEILEKVPKDERVACVGHSAILWRLTATKFDEKGMPIDGTHLENCQILEFEL